MGKAMAIIRSMPADLAHEVEEIFRQGETCLSAGSFAAAVSMFRLGIDLATAPLLPSLDDSRADPSLQVRRNLGPRINWMIQEGIIPGDLGKSFAALARDRHPGAQPRAATLEDAVDLLDFATTLYEVLFVKTKTTCMKPPKK
jgi:hypothetical protein